MVRHVRVRVSGDGVQVRDPVPTRGRVAGWVRSDTPTVTLSGAASEAAQSKGPLRETSPAPNRPVLS